MTERNYFNYSYITIDQPTINITTTKHGYTTTRFIILSKIL